MTVADLDALTWTRVPFPADWVDRAWSAIIAADDLQHDPLAITWEDLLDYQRRRWNVEDDGTILLFDELTVLRLELVSTPRLGTWLRILTEPALPGRAGSVQRMDTLFSFPTPDGADDPRTIVHLLDFVALPMLVLGSGDYSGPVWRTDRDLRGPLDVLTDDGQRLAGGVSVEEAVAVMRGLVGEDGTVIVRPTGVEAYVTPDRTGPSLRVAHTEPAR